MSSPNDPTRPNDSLISEDVLLDWAEGRLTPQQVADFAAQSGRVGLADRMVQMQADRATLRSLPMLKAPPVLMDRVMAALERESLVGLASGQPLEDHPPISLADYRAKRSARSVWPMRMAVAAGLTMLVGGAGYLAVQSFAPPHRSKSITDPIAMNATDPALEGTVVSDRSYAPAWPDVNAIALNDAPAAATESVEMKVAVSADAPPPIIDAARAAELAREGRLIVRAGPARADSIDNLTARDRTWRISKAIPQTMTDAVTRLAADRAPLSRTIMADSRDSRSRAEREALIVTSLAPMIGPGAAHSFMANSAAPTAPAAYMCESVDSPAALEGLKAGLEARLKTSISFEELAEPLPPAAPRDGADVLWWTKGPGAWVTRVNVPVLVDRK